jgi:thiol-disulfide isomerase/thioredoxin
MLKKLILTFIAACTALGTPCGAYQIANDFTVYNRTTGEPIRRADFAGKILVLDFVAHWCVPCRESSPKMQMIGEDFRKAGGNIHGVEVVVLAVNVEPKDPELTDTFLSEVGFDFVADDFEKEGGNGLYAQFRKGSLPHFSIINGVAGNNRKQWEVVSNSFGFYGFTYVDVINSLKAPGHKEPNIQIEVDYLAQYHALDHQLSNGDLLEDFGVTKPGRTGKSKTFIIRNSGTKTLNLKDIRISGTYRKDFLMRMQREKSLKPGQGLRVKITHKPSGKGMRSALLTIQSNDPDQKTFRIKLRGGFDNPFPPYI